MKFTLKSFLLLSTFALLTQCGIYSFTGGDTGNAKTIQVDFFNNNAQFVEPSLGQKFTLALQDFFISQTNLDLVRDNGDLQFQGEVTRYTIIPVTATANQRTAQNRLTIEFNVRYINQLDETKNFEQKFSHFFDYDANVSLLGSDLDNAFEEIFERVIQNIFNSSVGGW